MRFSNTRFYQALDSTNDEARRIAEQEAPDTPQIIWTTNQKKGRGRYQRNWEFFPGNLACSLLIPNIDLRNASQLSFVTALAVYEMIACKNCHLKWPNDVLVNGKKIAGILLETCSPYIVIGIGVNLMQFPKNIGATSLIHETGETIEAGQALKILANFFEDYFERWKNQGFEVIRKKWMQNAHTRQEKLEVRTGKDVFSGRFVEIDVEGGLILEVPDKGLIRIFAGDVSHVAGD